MVSNGREREREKGSGEGGRREEEGRGKEGGRGGGNSQNSHTFQSVLLITMYQQPIQEIQYTHQYTSGTSSGCEWHI